MLKELFFPENKNGVSDFVLANIEADLKRYFLEDDLGRNLFYASSLPSALVRCHLRFKSEMIVAGMPFFFATFKYLGADISTLSKNLEGSFQNAGTHHSFELPFNIALTGERIALNLLQRASSIATYTRRFVDLVEKSGKKIAILDTRKTTPGLRSLEKYAVRVGGGSNHRFGQADMWMIKDNHKKFFGGLTNAVNHFRALQTFYQPIEVEIHELDEVNEAINLGITHLMLDNFSLTDIEKAVSIKPKGVIYEISGGITLETMNNYLIDGVDAISIGALTSSAPRVDVSLKMERK